MSRAYYCETCDRGSRWRITRRGDVVTTWACGRHLDQVCARLHTGRAELVELVVTASRDASATLHLRPGLLSRLKTKAETLMIRSGLAA